MKKNRRHLTIRIFLITCFLLMLVGGITCAAIAYMTPSSYTSVLESEIKSEGQTLIKRLQSIPISESERELNEFARKTGAYLRLTDAQGKVWFDTLPDQTYLVQGDIMISQDEVDSIAQVNEQEQTIEQEGIVYRTNYAIQEVTYSGEGFSGESSFTYEVNFSDGRHGELMILGGMKEINQAMEALKKMLPFLLVVILSISLIGAAFYAVLITKPILALSRIAGQMANLDFSAHWNDKRSDEIGMLGTSLNTLSGNLSSTLDQLREANAALQADIDHEKELEKQRTAFFAAASHELKTPVTILKGQLSGMLAQVGIYRDREKYLARSLEVTGRMENLIKEILIISRIESSNFSVGEEKVDFSALVREQFQADAEILEEKQLTSDISIEPNLYMTGNRNLLANALDNIYMNAILYSPQGACIRVDLTREQLRVENTGVFIPDDLLGNLFTPFFRVEQSRNRKTGGSGLGLYLVKSIFALHGISCEIKNSLEGVCFIADLKNLQMNSK